MKLLDICGQGSITDTLILAQLAKDFKNSLFKIFAICIPLVTKFFGKPNADDVISGFIVMDSGSSLFGQLFDSDFRNNSRPMMSRDRYG